MHSSSTCCTPLNSRLQKRSKSCTSSIHSDQRRTTPDIITKGSPSSEATTKFLRCSSVHFLGCSSIHLIGRPSDPPHPGPKIYAGGCYLVYPGGAQYQAQESVYVPASSEDPIVSCSVQQYRHWRLRRDDIVLGIRTSTILSTLGFGLEDAHAIALGTFANLRSMKPSEIFTRTPHGLDAGIHS